ncbi:MAG: protein kinase [Gemmatales bacterium]|nr:protein kinase [Gemmatales bacterium]MDW7994792.1 protein kinase [Gemmatales bacterium]
MAYTVENYCGLIMRSKLLSPEAVQELCNRWRESARDPRDTKAFARWLVQNQYLTEYQAALLLHGYADNFFLGPYKILERVAKGRMAGIYRAIHVASNQVVALKVLPPSSARDPVLLARFFREAEIARELVHPNIVRTFHAGEHNGIYFLVMEYLDGATLAEVLEQRRTLTPLETARIGFFISQALQHLYEKHVVHRDLKPANIMLVPEPKPSELTLRCVVKLLDIGLAREIFEPKRAPQHAELTMEVAIFGNPDYMAPEQARDARRVDIRADLYSLGCILYECLAGQPPFADTNPIRQLARHATEAPRPLSEINPQVSETLWQILARLLAKNPEDRFPTPAAAAEAFKAVLKELPAEPLDQAQAQSAEYLAWLQHQHAARAQPGASGSSSSVKLAKPPPSLKQLKRRRRQGRVIRLPTPPEKRPGPPEVSSTPSESREPRSAPPSVGAVPGSPSVVVAPTSPTSASVAPTPESEAAPARLASAVPPQASPDSSAASASWLQLINVEPVSPADLVKAPFGLPVPRDLFMFLLGAISVLVLVGLIWLLVWFASPPPLPPPELE